MLSLACQQCIVDEGDKSLTLNLAQGQGQSFNRMPTYTSFVKAQFTEKVTFAVRAKYIACRLTAHP